MTGAGCSPRPGPSGVPRRTRSQTLRSILVLAFASMWIGCVAPVQSQAPLFALAPGSPVEVGAGSGQVVFADFNGDGHLDMMTRHLLGQLVTVQSGDGTGRFVAAPGSPIRLGFQPADMQLGDLNSDRLPDLVVRRGGRDEVDVLLGNAEGGFALTPGSPFAASRFVYSPTKPALHLVDINADGNLDAVTTDARRSKFATLLGDGRGSFSRGPFTKLASDRSWYTLRLWRC